MRGAAVAVKCRKLAIEFSFNLTWVVFLSFLMILQYWRAGRFSTRRSEAKVGISLRTGCVLSGEKFHQIYAT